MAISVKDCRTALFLFLISYIKALIISGKYFQAVPAGQYDFHFTIVFGNFTHNINFLVLEVLNVKAVRLHLGNLAFKDYKRHLSGSVIDCHKVAAPAF